MTNRFRLITPQGSSFLSLKKPEVLRRARLCTLKRRVAQSWQRAFFPRVRKCWNVGQRVECLIRLTLKRKDGRVRLVTKQLAEEFGRCDTFCHHDHRCKMTPLHIWVTTSVPRTLLAPPTSLSNGLNIPANKRARWCSHNVRCLHPRVGSGQGHLQYSASSNRIWYRMRSLDYDSGVFPLLSEDEPPTDVYLGHDVKRSGFR
jgi:hypothetical protein